MVVTFYESYRPCYAQDFHNCVDFQRSIANENCLSGPFNQLLLECPITTELFQKNGYDFNAYSNVRDILYNTDVIISIVKLAIRRPVGKLV